MDGGCLTDLKLRKSQWEMMFWSVFFFINKLWIYQEMGKCDDAMTKILWISPKRRENRRSKVLNHQ
jgi:hypothetical protein